MWLALWLACGQETPVEAVAKTEVPEVPIQKPLQETSKPLEGTLFFAKSPECLSDCVGSVTRQVEEWTPQKALDTLYEGPLAHEEGWRLIDCGSTGAKLQTIEEGVAKVQLVGSCGGCGTMSVYDLIVPTLKTFPEVNVVHIYDSSGKSQIEGPKVDSRPACLEP